MRSVIKHISSMSNRFFSSSRLPNTYYTCEFDPKSLTISSKNTAEINPKYFAFATKDKLDDFLLGISPVSNSPLCMFFTTKETPYVVDGSGDSVCTFSEENKKIEVNVLAYTENHGEKVTVLNDFEESSFTTSKNP